MKKLLLLLLLASCGDKSQNIRTQFEAETEFLYKPDIVIIDGCEYIKYRTGNYDAITHKGNCKNHKK
jgi:hypothetical protein